MTSMIIKIVCYQRNNITMLMLYGQGSNIKGNLSFIPKHSTIFTLYEYFRALNKLNLAV